jgi:very-short-patch-repair endonuclease
MIGRLPACLDPDNSVHRAPEDRSESPVERMMLAALRAYVGSAGFFVRQQVPIDTCRMQYRADFAVTDGSVWIDVEVDGHGFHASKPERAAYDCRRNRDVQRAGWLVMRFTGSEVYRDAPGCALEVLATLEAWRSDPE